MRKIRFASIYLFTLAVVFFVLGIYTEWHFIALIRKIKHQPLGYTEYLHLVFFLLGFLALCSIYFAEKMEVKILSRANAVLQKEIVKREKTEAALRKSQEKNKYLYEEAKHAKEVYRSLLHSSADAIVIYDLEGTTEYISPVFTQIFGWTLEELKGKQIPFLPEFERESTMAIIKDLVEKGTPCHGFETKRYTKDGRLLEVSISASRYDDNQGKPAGTLVILRDISEKKKFEAKLQYMERMEAIGTLAGGIAHDFNNLMMGMQGNISLILYDANSSHPYYEKLKNIEKLIQSGSELTRQLLGYARKGKYEVKPINLNQIVKYNSETFGRTRKNITIHREFAEDLFAIKADESQIGQVLINLYINAADAMPDGGELILKTMNVTHRKMKNKRYDPKPGHYVLLQVTDNGTGMDEKTIERIFEPFFTTKEMGGGSGLGLASVYGIIKGHGGYIDVDSEKGHGTTFSIYLPASDQSVQKTSEPYERIIKGDETVLLVDDEEVVIDVGVQLLKKLGYNVLEAGSGKEAIQLFGEWCDKIDIVILDMIMPDIGGGEVYDSIKEIDPQVKVLLSSGYSIDGQATDILERGCNSFIQKPFNMKVLSKKIREVLNKHQS
ncbi:MAG: PAS domain S-box protein [Desulfobacterales bacterium]|jgi:two-component system cell cycle sensor histidine kinase/response regulator CckA